MKDAPQQPAANADEDINTLLRRQVSHYPYKTAIHFDGKSLSYHTFQRQVDQATNALRGLPLQAGDRIAWYGLNHPDMLVLLFAAARCHLILVPLNWRLAEKELLYILADAEPVYLFHDRHFADQAQHLCCDYVTGCRAVTLKALEIVNNYNDQQQTIATANHRLSCESGEADMPLMIVYTSGTTGKPKGAVLSQRSFLCNARMSWDMHGMTVDDHILGLLPMFHVGGFNILVLPALLCGATVTLLDKFDPIPAARVLLAQDITLTVVVPTVLQSLIDTSLWQENAFPALRAISIGSTDVPLPLIQAVHQRKIPVLQVYGATETGPIAIYQQGHHAFETVGSIGRCGNECEIRLQAGGQAVPPGENGEILVRGDNVLSHYWKNPEATAEALHDGWFHTGDVARVDANGFYWFADRLKHVIISGGENIYPAELERVVRDFTGIAELSIVGRPDEKWGEIAVIVAVRSPYSDRSEAELKQGLLAAFHDQLARYKHPRDVIFIDKLPRTALGKVQLEVLKAQLAAPEKPLG